MHIAEVCVRVGIPNNFLPVRFPIYKNNDRVREIEKQKTKPPSSLLMRVISEEINKRRLFFQRTPLREIRMNWTMDTDDGSP